MPTYFHLLYFYPTYHPPKMHKPTTYYIKRCSKSLHSSFLQQTIFEKQFLKLENTTKLSITPCMHKNQFLSAFSWIQHTTKENYSVYCSIGQMFFVTQVFIWPLACRIPQLNILKMLPLNVFKSRLKYLLDSNYLISQFLLS